ncbi:hypothetical protein VTN31DRAFT_6803 [Thermomyces dupontii]|uniref:uncharacterized protein n=1 Tax=Talaromyces thermophilus TaxID=28565 RepID=UPI003743D8CF
MASANWDDEESTPPEIAGRRKFEDEEDEVLDSWDAAEDSEAEREKAAAAAAAKAEAEAAAKKKSRAERIAEHQRERQRRKEEQKQSGEDEEEDEYERRLRLRRTEKEADLKHAEDLLGDLDLNRTRGRGAGKPVVVSIGGDSSDPNAVMDLSSLPVFKPTTKEQFSQLSAALLPLLTANAKKPQYALWVPEFAKALVRDLPSEQIRKVASALTTLSNEKMREERAADKSSKKTKAAKTKASLVTGRDLDKDITVYDDDDLGDDDFM